MKKYLVSGGSIMSRFDRQIHYISPIQVAQLFNVNPRECIFVSESTYVDINGVPRGLKEDDFIVLTPKGNGNYNLERELNE